MASNNNDTASYNIAVAIQKNEHQQREYEARRKHAYDLERQFNQQERQRI